MSNLSLKNIKELNALRKILHQNAELAFFENKTAEILNRFLTNYYPNDIWLKIAGTGLAAVFRGYDDGPTTIVRTDIDALPITEINNFSYKSSNKGISHKCGHDGHMTIVAGLAMLFNINRDFKGNVILLFQPAEETGEGAKKVLKDKRIIDSNPDYVMALHNLPGFSKGEIIYREEHFASASTGMIIKLTGKTSHAAEPENGNSPVNGMVGIIETLETLVKNLKEKINDFALVTVIHSRLGEKAFGTTPGYAEVMATLRSYRNDDMELLKKEAVKVSRKIAKEEGLKIKINWTEEFPATINDKECVNLLKDIARKNKLRSRQLVSPFKWSEDFGHFTNKYKGVMFGLGAGINTPQLHNPDYDYPDDITKVGVNVLYNMVRKLNS